MTLTKWMSDSVASVLDRLDAQARQSPLARDAARVIRLLMEQMSSTEADLIETEFSRYAHAVEIDRLIRMRISATTSRGRGR
jgi:hypothetical protein